MLRRVDDSERPQHAHVAEQAAAAPEHIVPAASDAEFDGSLLPRDHPKWAKDALTISQRARDLIARLRPVAIMVLTFWDHRVRSAIVGGNRIGIDAAGTYRLE